jgi:hypothetical protein
MNQSRLMWGLGGIAGLLMTSVVLTVKLAVTPVTLKVRVIDQEGPLAGVWVSLEDRDVLVTDAGGAVEIKGPRWQLDNAVLTISDPSVEKLHLSQNRRADISWSPWKSSAELEVQLPTVASDPWAGNTAGQESSAIDLPFDENSSAALNASREASAQRMPAFLREEELAGLEDAAKIPADVLVDPRRATANDNGGSNLSCRLLGIAGYFCTGTANIAPPPDLTARLAPAWFSFSARFASGSETANAGAGLASTPLETPPSESESARRSASLVKTSKVKIQVVSAGLPLAGARVFMSRMKDNRVQELGLTAADGVLESRIPREFFGESVTIFQECCAPKSFAVKFNSKSETEPLRFELSPGSGFAALIQREAYGFLRKVEQSELHSGKGKLTVSGSDGFAIYNNSKTPDHIVSNVKVRGAKPSEFRVSVDEVKSSTSSPLGFLVSSEQTYLPALAIVERSDGKSFQGVLQNSELRRWRRDFIARLMQLQSLRPVVSIESESRISAAGESLPDVVTRGWSETHLAGEWDLLLSIQYNEAAGEVRVSAIDSFGNEFFESRNRLGSASAQVAPESSARKSFDAFVAAVPFEGGVLQQRDNELQLTFNDARQFGIKPGTTLAVYQESTEPGQNQRLSELAALAKVIEPQSAGAVSAVVTHWNVKNRKTGVLPDVVRVVKVAEEFYRRESQRKGLSRNLLSKGGSSSLRPL